MALLTPRLPTFVDGENVTTRALNVVGEHIRNLFVQTCSDVRARKPMCSVRRGPATSTTLAAGTPWFVPWELVDDDTESPAMASTTAGSSHYLTVRTAGYWWLDLEITATLAAAPSAWSWCTAQLYLNGLVEQRDVIAVGTAPALAGTDGCRVRAQTVLPLAAGDVLYGVFFQSSAASAVFSATPGSTRMSAEWLSPLTPIGG